MLKFYYHPSPNPAKVALFLEDAALPYGSLTRSVPARPRCAPARSRSGTPSKRKWMTKRVATCFRRT